MARGTKSKQFSVEGMQKLYINKNLTSRRKKLFRRAKQKVAQCKYQYYWTNKGDIYVRQNQTAEAIQINTDDDLNKIAYKDKS